MSRYRVPNTLRETKSIKEITWRQYDEGERKISDLEEQLNILENERGQLQTWYSNLANKGSLTRALKTRYRDELKDIDEDVESLERKLDFEVRDQNRRKSRLKVLNEHQFTLERRARTDNNRITAGQRKIFKFCLFLVPVGVIFFLFFRMRYNVHFGILTTAGTIMGAVYSYIFNHYKKKWKPPILNFVFIRKVLLSSMITSIPITLIIAYGAAILVEDIIKDHIIPESWVSFFQSNVEPGDTYGSSHEEDTTEQPNNIYLPPITFANLENYSFASIDKATYLIGRGMINTFTQAFPLDERRSTPIEYHTRFHEYSYRLGDAHGTVFNYHREAFEETEDYQQWADVLRNEIIYNASAADNILHVSENRRQTSVRHIELGDAVVVTQCGERHHYYSMAYTFAIRAIFTAVYENNMGRVHSIILRNIIGDVDADTGDVGSLSRIRELYLEIDDTDMVAYIDHLKDAFRYVAAQALIHGFD